MLKERFGKIYAKLNRKYRMVFYEEESLSQARTIHVKPLHVLIFGSLAVLLVVVATSTAIFVTPFIREMIPGYDDPQLAQDYKKLAETALFLERKVEEQDSMLASFSTLAGMESSGQGNTLSLPDPIEVDEEDPVIVDEGKGDLVEVASPTVAKQPAIQPGRQEAESAVMNLVKPVDGIVTMGFDSGEGHFGIDLVDNENSFIRSAADGVVILSEYSHTNGYIIGISHSQYNLISFYKHNSRVFKSVGSYVFAGEAIAVIGNTGKNSSGPHLHFELWYDNNPVDPLDYVVFN